MTFAELEQRRTEAGIGQKDLCRRAGVNASTYSQIKHGHRGGYVRTIEKLAAALDRLLPQEGGNGQA